MSDHDDAITVPLVQQRCLACQYDLRGTIESGGRRCPECSHEFNLQDLLRTSDEAGEPHTLSPHEFVVTGRVVMLSFLAVFGVALLVLMALWLRVFF